MHGEYKSTVDRGQENNSTGKTGWDEQKVLNKGNFLGKLNILLI